MNSLSPSLHRAVMRACWLAELASALDQADKITRAMCDHRRDRVGLAEAIILRHHIVVLRSEIDALQRKREPDAWQFHPKRM